MCPLALTLRHSFLILIDSAHSPFAQFLYDLIASGKGRAWRKFFLFCLLSGLESI